MLTALDYFFTILHTGVVMFCLMGWAWKGTRRYHLLIISLTLLSWFGLGAVYGWGYCPSTDLHWHVKRELGETDLPISYIKYLADKLTGVKWPSSFVDTVTIVFTLSAFLLSSWLNWRDSR